MARSWPVHEPERPQDLQVKPNPDVTHPGGPPVAPLAPTCFRSMAAGWKVWPRWNTGSASCPPQDW